MACPLSFILNDSNKSPQNSRNWDENDNEEDDDDEEELNSAETQGPNSPSPSQPSFSIDNTVTRLERNNPPQIRAPIAGLKHPISFLAPRSSSPPSRWKESDPPPHELDFDKFNVFKALFNCPSLVLEVAKHLEIEDLVSLYSISKDFHDLANTRFTTLILSQSTSKAPESSQIFIFSCYKSLCQHDPAARISEKRPDHVRDIPSLRWLRMVLFREAVINQIIECLNAEGHFMPKRASLAIKKLWFTLDIGTNAHRIGVLHNKEFWADRDFYLATMFFMKLDMRFTHPTAGNGERGMRQMILGQRSLSTLCRVLMRQELKSQLDLLRMIVEWNYVSAPEHREMSILGVPPKRVGRMQYEGWGKGTQMFVLIDRLVMLEAIKRNLKIHLHYQDMMLYGYIDKKTQRCVALVAESARRG